MQDIMKKALIITTVSGFVPQFEMNNVSILQKMEIEVHYAANFETPSYGNNNHRLSGTGIICHQVDFVRSPFKKKNLTVYKQLKDIMRMEHFDIVHCHTPMGGVMARLVAHVTSTKPIIYTAHGFHFYKGAPFINWLCYYPVERFLSRYTDQLICINMEDNLRAQRFQAKCINYIPGVGIELKPFYSTKKLDTVIKKTELGLPLDKKILLSAGELIKRKNHETIIRAIAKLNDNSMIYVICGHGILEEYLKRLAEALGVEQQIYFLGYRTDISEVLRIADLFVFPSYQEGLPVALLEAMASGRPVLCSDIRGSRDLMGKGKVMRSMTLCSGGIMIKRADDIDTYCNSIIYMFSGKLSLSELGNYNELRAADFSIQKVSGEMEKIYRKWIRN